MTKLDSFDVDLDARARPGLISALTLARERIEAAYDLLPRCERVQSIQLSRDWCAIQRAIAVLDKVEGVS